MSKDREWPSGSGKPPTGGPPSSTGSSQEPSPFRPDLDLITYIERSQKPRKTKKA